MATTVGSLINGIQVGAVGVFVVVALGLFFRIGRDVPILKHTLVAAFTVLMGGIAFGKYYALTAPKRLESIEVSNPATAVLGYTEAIRLNPGDAGLYFRRGRTDFRMKRYPEAVADFTKALEISPDNPTYLSDRAAAYLFLGDRGSANADIDRAIRLGYRNADMFLMKGIILDSRMNYDEAIKTYTAALSMGLKHQNYCFALANRALSYESKRAYSLALDDWNKRYSDCPEHREDTLVDRGSVYSLMDKDELALLDWRAALELDPNDPAVFKNRALLFMSARRNDSALADLNRYIELRPDDPYGYSTRAIILISMGDREGFSRDLNAARKLEIPNRANPYQKLPKAVFDGWLQWELQGNAQ